MTQTHGSEPLSKQVITFLSNYCKTGLDGIEYYPALHSFDLYFNIESLVGPFIKRNDFKIHVQKPYMNEELYDIFTDLVKLIYLKRVTLRWLGNMLNVLRKLNKKKLK